MHFVTKIVKDDKFYMAIVLPLRKSSLRKMIQMGHNNQDINLNVLAKLKPIVCGGVDGQHGDLKVIKKIIINRLNSISLRISLSITITTAIM